MAVAQLPESSPHVTKVVHPGLPSHPNHDTAKVQAKCFSGMVTFCVKGSGDNVKKLFKALKVVTLVESLGGFESLVDYPITMTHAAIPKEKREKIGITDIQVRMFVGLEDTYDILEDLKQALQDLQLPHSFCHCLRETVQEENCKNGLLKRLLVFLVNCSQGPTYIFLPLPQR